MISFIINRISNFRARLEIARKKRWWNVLRAKGMQLGKGVNLPISTQVDISHCCLISIGNNCGFGDECVILAHDAMPNEYLDASIIGRVMIKESCHFGTRTVILPGVSIGPGSVVGANSVVIHDIPPHTLVAGNPAKVVCTMEEYLDRHREKMKSAPNFDFKKYDEAYLTPERMVEMVTKLEAAKGRKGYMVGGYTAMKQDGECLVLTE